MAEVIQAFKTPAVTFEHRIVFRLTVLKRSGVPPRRRDRKTGRCLLLFEGFRNLVRQVHACVGLDKPLLFRPLEIIGEILVARFPAKGRRLGGNRLPVVTLKRGQVSDSRVKVRLHALPRREVVNHVQQVALQVAEQLNVGVCGVGVLGSVPSGNNPGYGWDLRTRGDRDDKTQEE
jgi:hypothetical protein